MLNIWKVSLKNYMISAMIIIVISLVLLIIQLIIGI